MNFADYERMINSVAEQVSAPDYFPAIMPENDLHPDPAVLRAEIVTLRTRITELERRFNEFSASQDASAGKPNVKQFPNR